MIFNEGEPIMREVEKKVDGNANDHIGIPRIQMTLIRTIFELPLKQSILFKLLGIKPQKGILLYGQPCYGKTLIIKVITN